MKPATIVVNIFVLTTIVQNFNQICYNLIKNNHQNFKQSNTHMYTVFDNLQSVLLVLYKF